MRTAADHTGCGVTMSTIVDAQFIASGSFDPFDAGFMTVVRRLP
jgi:hypothetical protein